MPHSEVTHPQAPPAREIYRANPTTPEAETVRALGEQFKRSAEILFTGFRTEASYSELKSATDNAGQYSSSISRFWSHARENACDRYLHQKLDGNDWHVDTAWFNGTNNELKELDRTLSRKLSAWEEATSPKTTNPRARPNIPRKRPNTSTT